MDILFKQADTNGDGEIDFEEFCGMMTVLAAQAAAEADASKPADVS